MSPRFWELFGVDPATRSHSPAEWQDLIYPEDPNHPYDQIVRYKHAAGGTVWVRCRGIAIRDPLGRPVRMLGAHNDLTELKKNEERLAELLEQVNRGGLE